MASAAPATQPLLANQAPEPEWKRTAKVYGKKCAIITLAFFAVVFVLAWLLQGLMYSYATSMNGCAEGALQGYDYDGDAPPEDNPVYNIIPRMSLLTERAATLSSQAFSAFPANEASTIAGAQVGTWWQTWGPIFYTYTYEDMNSKTLVYMRQNLLRIGSSHRIGRCDGKGPFVTFTEGGNWFGNRVRMILGYNQAMNFQIWLDDEKVGFAQEANGGVPSVTFRNNHDDFLGSAVLLGQNLHTTDEHWLMNMKNNMTKSNMTKAVPYWVNSAATLLFAYHTIGVEASRTPATSAFLAQAPRIFLPGNTTKAAVPSVERQVAATAAQANLSEVEHI